MILPKAQRKPAGMYHNTCNTPAHLGIHSERQRETARRWTDASWSLARKLSAHQTGNPMKKP